MIVSIGCVLIVLTQCCFWVCQALENDEEQPELAKLAKYHLSRYEFPVMMSVSLPNGTIVHTVNANNFLDAGKDISILESGYVWQS